MNIQQDAQKDILKSINSKDQEIVRLSNLVDSYKEFNIKFENFDKIDWETYAKQIQEKEKLINDLEKANDKVKKLNEQLAKVKNELKHLTDVEIEHKKMESYDLSNRKKSILSSVEISRGILESIGKPEGLSAIENVNPDLRNLKYDEIGTKQKLFHESNSKRISDTEYKKRVVS